MATTASVLRDAPQAHALRKVVLGWDTGTGLSWANITRMSVGIDAQAYATARIPIEDGRQQQAEREQAFQIAADGGNPDNETWHLNTLDQIRQYVYRRIMNTMRDEFVFPGKAAMAGNLSTPTGYINAHQANAIAGFIDDPAWNTPTTNGAVGNIQAVGVNIVQLDHGEAELSLDI